MSIFNIAFNLSAFESKNISIIRVVAVSQ